MPHRTEHLLLSYSWIYLEAGRGDVENISGVTSASHAPYCTSVTPALLAIWPEQWEDGLEAACN